MNSILMFRFEAETNEPLEQGVLNLVWSKIINIAINYT
jgi:hypothetical protein